jgi:hypothetical protein
MGLKMVVIIDWCGRYLEFLMNPDFNEFVKILSMETVDHKNNFE